MKWPPLRYIFVMSVPYVAAVSSISGPRFWGLRYTGFIWSAVLALGLLLILEHRGPIPFPWRIWLPWFGYIFLSIAWGGIHGRHSLQDPLQIVTPLIVGIVASFSIRDEVQLAKLMRGFTHCLLFVAVVFVFFWYGPGAPFQKFGTGYCVRPSAMTASLIGCLFVARMHRNAFRSVLGWAACLAIAVFSESRMATLVLLLSWCASPLYRPLRSRLLVFAAMCVLAVGLFYSPIFQRRFFASGKGSLKQVAKGDFSGSGRFETWPQLWREGQKHIVFGAGAGEVVRLAFRRELHKGVSSPCNDYLRIILEFGIVGLFLFLSSALRQMHLLRKMMRFKEQSENWALAAAYLGFFALLVLSITENAMIYGVYFMHPLFAVLGAAYGVANLKARTPSQSRVSVNCASDRLLG